MRNLGWVLVVLGALAAVPLWALRLVPSLQALGFLTIAASSFIPFIWIPTLLVCVGLVLIRGRLRWVGVAGLVAMLVVWGLPLIGSMSTPPPAGDLRYISINVQYGGADVDDVVALVEPETDLIAIQEHTPAFAEALAGAGITEQFPHMVGTARTDAGGTAVYAREPIELVDTYDQVFTNLVVRTSEQAGEQFTVAVVHTAPPQLGADVWVRDAAGIAEWLAPHVDNRFVAMGDFNAIHQHLTMGYFRDIGLFDAQSSFTLGQSRLAKWRPTWPQNMMVPPFVRIDHVLFGPGAVFAGNRYEVVAGTDHSAVLGGMFAHR